MALFYWFLCLVSYGTYLSQVGRYLTPFYSGSGALGLGAESFVRGVDLHGNRIACDGVQCSICAGLASARDAQSRGDENMVEPVECSSSPSFTEYLDKIQDNEETAYLGRMRANMLMLMQLLWRNN